MRNKNKTIKFKWYTKIYLYKGREKREENNMKHKTKNNETHITNTDNQTVNQ